jgi:hypothetical protein
VSAALQQIFLSQVGSTSGPAFTITSSNTDSVAENATLSHSLTASVSVSWSIVGGNDQAQFQISSSTLQWSSNGTRDYESPADANTDNAYLVNVRATDGSSNTVDQSITITVTNVGATWDSGTVTAVTLSSGDLVATCTGTTSANQGAHVVTSLGKSSGKYYYEVEFTSGLHGGNYGAGAGTTASTYSNMGNSATTGAMLFKSGNFWVNGSSFSFFGARSAGDRFGFAVDLDNLKVWVKRVSGTPSNWNNDGSADPATNTNGKTLPSGTYVPFCTFGGSGGASGDVITLIAPASHTLTAPSGFAAGWPES